MQTTLIKLTQLLKKTKKIKIGEGCVLEERGPKGTGWRMAEGHEEGMGSTDAH